MWLEELQQRLGRTREQCYAGTRLCARWLNTGSCPGASQGQCENGHDALLVLFHLSVAILKWPDRARGGIQRTVTNDTGLVDPRFEHMCPDSFYQGFVNNIIHIPCRSHRCLGGEPNTYYYLRPWVQRDSPTGNTWFVPAHVLDNVKFCSFYLLEQAALTVFRRTNKTNRAPYIPGLLEMGFRNYELESD